MSKTLEASQYPTLRLDSLEAPVAGQLARAEEMESAFQQLLDNDAALAEMIGSMGGGGGGGVVMALEFPMNDLLEDQNNESVITVPAIGLICAVGSSGGRVTVYANRGGGDDVGRGLYQAPNANAAAIADIAFGENNYNRTIYLDRPLPYAVEGYGGGVGNLLLRYVPWHEDPESTVFLYILPLGGWDSANSAS